MVRGVWSTGSRNLDSGAVRSVRDTRVAPHASSVKQAASMRPSHGRLHHDEEPDDDDDDGDDERRERDRGDRGAFAFILLTARVETKAGAPESSVSVEPLESDKGTKGAAPTESTTAFGWPAFAISASD
jgi:hypothetical protein